jgi:hypothetical protein
VLKNSVEFKDAFFEAPQNKVELGEQLSSVMNSLIYRPTIFQRNEIRWISVFNWRAGSKITGLAALKRAKRELDRQVIAEAAVAVAALAVQLFGDQPADGVTNVPCGHSCRPDCFGKRLAQSVADNLEIPFVQMFADRPRTGVSHPKRSANVTPLRRIGSPPGSLLLVDDLATSGQHLEESTLALRKLGVPVSAMAWISGVVKGGPPYSPASMAREPDASNEDIVVY